MDLRRQKKLREDYLVSLWEMHGGNYGFSPDNKEVCRRIGINYDTEATIICQFLRGEGLISWVSFEGVNLEPKGRAEAERIMEERYSEKETRVLKKIYDMSGQNTTKLVGFQELVSAVGLSDSEVSGICKGLSDEQGLIEWEGGDFVLITRLGIDAIDSVGKTPPGGGDNYIINAHTINALQQGSGNVQNIQINPQFDQAIAALRELIESSQLPAHEIEDLQEQVAGLSRLAVSEPKPGLLEKVKARIDYIKLALVGTEALIKAGPQLEKVWHFLSRR